MPSITSINASEVEEMVMVEVEEMEERFVEVVVAEVKKR